MISKTFICQLPSPPTIMSGGMIIRFQKATTPDGTLALHGGSPYWQITATTARDINAIEASPAFHRKEVTVFTSADVADPAPVPEPPPNEVKPSPPRRKPNPPPPPEVIIEPPRPEFLKVDTAPVSNISVVITSHKRPDKLKACYESCREAGIKDIIITATGVTPPMRKVLNAFPKSVKKITNKRRSTSNDAWIAGVRAASNTHVLILHDDDLMLPNFMTEIEPHLGHPFIYYPARFHRTGDGQLEDIIRGPMEEIGILQTDKLSELLDTNDSRTITPVRGLFRKNDLVEWLIEAGQLLGRECYYRPDFLIGNDLWIWLRACWKYRTYYSLDTPIVSLGCDADSTTTADCAGDNRLPEMYNRARRAFKDVVSADAIQVSGLKPLHIITIVLDGACFLARQLEVFNRLELDWKWSIVEGVADNIKCTAWCKKIPPRLSLDGTTEMLDDYNHHSRIDVYRKPLWPGKVVMVNTPIEGYARENAVLMQVDMDEFWSTPQIESIVRMMSKDHRKANAMFWCRYFFGPDLVMDSRNCYANNPNQEWRRAWNWSRGQHFLRHEPPVMSGDQLQVIKHSQTEKLGLIFDHYGYGLECQVAFKEKYYGYKDAVDGWRKLQRAGKGRHRLADYLSWVDDEKAVVRRLP